MADDEAPAPAASGSGRGDHRQAVDGTHYTTAADIERAFLEALAEHGLAPADGERIPADGTLHRYRVDGDRLGRRNGWAVLHLDGIPAGAAGSWRTDQSITWCARRERDLTDAERRAMRERIEAARAERDRRRQVDAQRAAERARRIYESAGPASPVHPYLQAKGIEPLPAMRQSGDRLVVPLHRVPSGELVGLQFIDADGGKRFLRGTEKRGAAFPIPPATGDRSCPLIVAEGVATAATVASATGWQAVAALDAGNIDTVVAALRSKHADRTIKIAADRDGEDGGVGVAKAAAAAKAHHAHVVAPPTPGDWNDIACTRGVAAVREAFEAAAADTPQEPEVESSTESSVEPFDLSQASVAHMLEADPPPRVWIVDDLLPLGVVGLLAAAGKAGKTMLVLQLAISITTGRPWLGMEIGHTGSVLLLSAEDDRQEVWRRLRAIVTRMQIDGELSEADLELIAERLYVFDRVGDDNRLTARVDRGELFRTGIADRVIATAQELPGIALIGLDPLARFDGGEPNANDDATRLIEAAEYIRRGTGATVMLPHHVGKVSMANEDAGQEAVRGASALVDGARWVGLLQRLRRVDAEKYGLSKDDADWYVRLTTPALSYAPPWPGMWLQRLPGGVLAPANLAERSDERQEQRAEDRYREVLPKLRGLIQQCQEKGEPMTRRRLRDYAGKSGLFGVGDQTLRGIVERALAEGEIRAHPAQDGRTTELRTW